MALFSTSYFPNIEYIDSLSQFKTAKIDAHENYLKQSFRNRCEILSANGKVSLSIPVLKKHRQKTVAKDTRISYAENWQKNHLRAIESSYNSSPFYEFYQDYFAPFFSKKYEFLMDLNNEILEVLLELFEIDTQIIHTTDYIQDCKDDFRSLSPKVACSKEYKPYSQVFSEKFGFTPNLSSLDLLCCQGPNAALMFA